MCASFALRQQWGIAVVSIGNQVKCESRQCLNWMANGGAHMDGCSHFPCPSVSTSWKQYAKRLCPIANDRVTHEILGDLQTQQQTKGERERRGEALTMMVPRWCSSVSGPVDVIAPFDVVAMAANVEFAGDTDVVVVDSVVTVIDELANKWWWFSKLFDVFEMDWVAFVLLCAAIDEDAFALAAAAATAAAAAALFRVARFDARADIRRFKSSRNSDFSGDTYAHVCQTKRNETKRMTEETKNEKRNQTKQSRMNEWMLTWFCKYRRMDCINAFVPIKINIFVVGCSFSLFLR